MDFNKFFSPPMDQANSFALTKEYSSGNEQKLVSFVGYSNHPIFSGLLMASIPIKLLSLDWRTFIVSLSFFAFAFIGCSPKGNVNMPPKPGEMKVISVAKLDRPKTIINKIKNGSFREWPAGANLCEGFSAPDSRFSTISRMQGEDDKNNTLFQKWTEIEETPFPDTCLRTSITGLKADTEYSFVAVCESIGFISASIMALEIDDTGSAAVLNPEVIMTNPVDHQLKQYVGTFRTRRGGTLTLAAFAKFMEGPEASIQWHEWVLFESTP